MNRIDIGPVASMLAQAAAAALARGDGLLARRLEDCRSAVERDAAEYEARLARANALLGRAENLERALGEKRWAQIQDAVAAGNEEVLPAARSLAASLALAERLLR